LRFSPPPETAAPAEDEAYRMLSQQLFSHGLAQAQQWSDTVEPILPREWLPYAGTSNTRVVVTVEELAAIEAEIEEILALYVNRPRGDVPPAALGVRLLRYYMPEAPDPDSAT
jgi:hypothetical protein